MRNCVSISIFITLLSTTVSIFAAPPPGVGPPSPNKGACRQNVVVNVIQGNIDFGSFGVSAAGTITIAPNAAGTRSATAGIDPVLTSTTSAMSFTVDNTMAGCEAFPVKLTMPAATTIDEAGGATMTLQNFVSSPATGFTQFPGTPVTVYVGADLLPAAGQTAGPYTSAAAFSVTVAY